MRHSSFTHSLTRSLATTQLIALFAHDPSVEDHAARFSRARGSALAVLGRALGGQGKGASALDVFSEGKREADKAGREDDLHTAGLLSAYADELIREWSEKQQQPAAGSKGRMKEALAFGSAEAPIGRVSHHKKKKLPKRRLARQTDDGETQWELAKNAAKFGSGPAFDGEEEEDEEVKVSRLGMGGGGRGGWK